MNRSVNQPKCACRLLGAASIAIAMIATGCTHEGDTARANDRVGVAANSGSPAVAQTQTPRRGAWKDAASPAQPIHSCVTVRELASGEEVAYTRSRGKPFGVAYMLKPGALDGCQSISVAITTQPSVRPQLCLTDEAGNVWNAPMSRDQGDERMRFDLSRVQPDPFQNASKSLPEKADLACVNMVTILDITGFMGGAEVPCTWTISEIELHYAAVSGGQGGA